MIQADGDVVHALADEVEKAAARLRQHPGPLALAGNQHGSLPV